MIEQKIRVVSEGLARTLDRRNFLQKSGSAVFAGIMALAAGHTLASNAMAGAEKKRTPLVPQCSPPGPYCNLDGQNLPNGCMGGRCFQHRSGGTIYACHVYYTYYPSGCWTRASGGGYWTCCDCDCGAGGTCGCAQFSLDPVPNPDGPTG